MASFEQFRSSFPTESGLKGERFEIFLAEWLFANHPMLSSQFKRVWRFSDWPYAWSGNDIGTDLIAEDQLGKICAIQAKFYSEDSSISKSGIDSFLSDTNRREVDYRLIVATTDQIGTNASRTIEGQEKPVQSFLLRDFLEPFDWPESIENLEKNKVAAKKSPRPHQIRAIEDVCSKLETRGQLIMACGTGKTLTGQRVAERLGSETTLILLPSLLLLSKTVSEWVKEREKDFLFLSVCSDSTVRTPQEDSHLKTRDLCFRPTTDAEEIADFLAKPGRKVVFSTYQSSRRIAEAFRESQISPLDLVIADEAHRCAGETSGDYALILNDAEIPAKKRLFMTATPRVFSSRLRNKAASEGLEVASMDDEKAFGPVLHRLTFGQAINNQPPLLSDYRVVVVGVNDARCLEMIHNRSLLKTTSGLVEDAKSLGAKIGLSKAIRDYSLKRVITFHSRVEGAAKFAEEFAVLQDDLNEASKPVGSLHSEHISGAMSTSLRNKKLKALGDRELADTHVLSNARCLSEGVDVPELDAVAFIDPKRSELDIIQAVGRAIRLSESKQLGTIVIPVFLSEEQDVETTISSSDFDQVWKVVNALRSHDETLAEELDSYRRSLGKGSTISVTGSKFVFDIPAEFPEEFASALGVRLVEKSTESWEYSYGMLVEYLERHGNLNVPVRFEGAGDYPLGKWVGTQRYEHRAGRLSQVRKMKLDEIGFVWDDLEDRWQTGFQYLTDYKKEFGDCLVPSDYQVDGFRLGYWVSTNRKDYKKERLSSSRVRLLEGLGFVWDRRDNVWAKSFEALERYKIQQGDCQVPANYVVGELNLGVWVKFQRALRQKGKLSSSRIEALDSLGFIWSELDLAWNLKFELLTSYTAENGHSSPSQSEIYKGEPLGQWVSAQRQKRSSLSPERIEKLEHLGFAWDAVTANWEYGFMSLQEFHAKEGHTKPAWTHRPDGFHLRNWIQSQVKRKEKLTKQQIDRLNSLGFDWG